MFTSAPVTSPVETLPTWENTIYRGDVRTALKAMTIDSMLRKTNTNAEKYISANNDTYCTGKCGVGLNSLCCGPFFF